MLSNPAGPERIHTADWNGTLLQFGEGNFLRGFVDYFIDCANERMGLDNKVIVVQPIKSGLADVINRQDGLYHLYLRGGEPSAPQVQSRLVSSISRAIDPYRDFEAFLACAEQPELRFIVSNTTEAGYPAVRRTGWRTARHFLSRRS